MILPHEHVFVDLRTPDQPGYGQAEAADVVALMAPEIERDQGARRHGDGRLRAGRRRAARRHPARRLRGDRLPAGRPDRDLSRAVGPGLGARRERGRTARLDARRADAARSRPAASRPAGSSSSAGDDGMTPCGGEDAAGGGARRRRRSARSSAATRSAGRVARDQLDIIEASGYTRRALHLDPRQRRARLRPQPGAGPPRRLDRVRLDRRAGRRTTCTSSGSAVCSTPAWATGCC